MTPKIPTIIDARSFMGPESGIVESAELLSRKLLEVLQGSHDVQVDFTALEGASSSYFNLIVRRLAGDARGREMLHRADAFKFRSAFSRSVFERSLKAVQDGS